MSKVLKFSVWIIGAVFVIVVVAAAVIWVWGGAKLNQSFDAPVVGITHSADPHIIAEGERLATVTGCNGCHKKRMQGGILGELPDGSRLVAPNIPRLAATLADGELARVIRYGVRKDGRGVFAMPSQSFFAMTDDDLTAVLSYIRATPDEGGELPNSRFGLMIRYYLTFDTFKLAPRYIDDMTTRPAYDLSDPAGRGEYIARIACAECHGLDFKGNEWPGETNPPDLIAASAYSPDQFKTLMKTGVGMNSRDLGLMSAVGRRRFSSFTDEEVDALYAFLRSRAATAQ